ncbi:hypothetical protein TPB0596_18130 [Tsukamurella pulmonis]|nr:hypothetical protein TPB0596_18130 [Tsukamurella pulmonis]
MREVLGEQLLGELPLETHQMIGGDGTGNGDRHDETLPWSATDVSGEPNRERVSDAPRASYSCVS